MSEGLKDNWKKGYNAYRAGASSPTDNQPHSGSWSGKTYGTLTIDSYENGKESEISYDAKNVGVVDAYDNAVYSTMLGGLGDIAVGTIGVLAAGSIEAASLGSASGVAYVTFAFSADRFMGGVNKFFDPKNYLNNDNEARPIKSLLLKYTGKNGATAYTYLELTTGVGSIYSAATNGVKSYSEGAWEVFGAYETVGGAKDELMKVIEDEPKGESKK